MPAITREAGARPRMSAWSRISAWRRALGLLPVLAGLAAGPVGAQSLCVFSVTGAQGDLWNQMQDYALTMRNDGVALGLRPYPREQLVAEDLKAGQCDAALMTGVRARQFNAYTGSIDAIGGLPGYDAVELLFQALARPTAAGPLRNGPYEVAGLLPLGAAWLFINDRRVNSIEKMVGRRLAVLDYDRAQLLMADRIGVIPVNADITNFAGKFNNGVVDVVASPAVAYRPLELYRGVGARGVVVKLPVAQITFQLLIRHDRFPAGFGQASRTRFLDLFKPAMKVIREAEDDLLFFYPPPDQDRDRYRHMLQEARIALTGAGVYDRQMMRLMKKVRCRLEPAAGECSDSRELTP